MESMTYELGDGPSREATVGAKFALSGQLVRRWRVILEDLYLTVSYVMAKWAVRASSHQCRRPSWWRLKWASFEEEIVGRETQSCRCSECACGFERCLEVYHEQRITRPLIVGQRAAQRRQC
jgi:hypothetical protein